MTLLELVLVQIVVLVALWKGLKRLFTRLNLVYDFFTLGGSHALIVLVGIYKYLLSC